MTALEIARAKAAAAGLAIELALAAHTRLMRVAFLSIQDFDGFANTPDKVRGRLVPMMEEAGFTTVAETHREATIFGTLALYRARHSPNGTRVSLDDLSAGARRQSRRT